MFKNEVNILKKYNKEQSSKLETIDYDIIKDIMKSMSIFKVNSYDAEVIRRDLIGMSQELRLRDSSLKESIGDNLTGFTGDIIKNTNGPSLLEIFLWPLSNISLYIFLTLIFSSFFLFGGLYWKATPPILLFHIGYGFIIFIIQGIVIPSFITRKGLMKMVPSIITVILISILMFITKYFIENGTVKVINVSSRILLSALTYIISKYFYTKHIHNLAKDKKNFIEDLI